MRTWLLSIARRVCAAEFGARTRERELAARLQAATGSKKPVLLRVDYEGGHGTIGGTKAQIQELYADQYSFLLWQFGDPGFQPPLSGSK